MTAFCFCVNKDMFVKNQNNWGNLWFLSKNSLDYPEKMLYNKENTKVLSKFKFSQKKGTVFYGIR